MEIQLSVHEWLKLPMDIRQKLRENFNIPKSQGVLVEDNEVKSDGTTYKDLGSITVEKMQTHLEREDSDFVSLFNEVVARLEDEVQPELPVELEIDPQQLIIDKWELNLKQMKLEAEGGMEFMLKSLIDRMFPRIINQTHDVKAKRGRPKKTH